MKNEIEPKEEIDILAQEPKEALERRVLAVQALKLRAELEGQRQPATGLGKITPWLPLVTALVSVIGLYYSAAKFGADETARITEAAGKKDTADRQLAAAENTRRLAQVEDFRNRTEALKQEVARPFWEKQLATYLQAAAAAATIATSRDRETRRQAEATFWILFWGPMSAVEDVTLNGVGTEVQSAMVSFGAEVERIKPGEMDPSTQDFESLEQKSLTIAQTMRAKLAPAFNLKAPEASSKSRLEQPRINR